VWSTDRGSTMKSRAPAGTPVVGPTYGGAMGGMVLPLQMPQSDRPFVPGHVWTPLTVVGWLQAAGVDAEPLPQSLVPVPLHRSWWLLTSTKFDGGAARATWTNNPVPTTRNAAVRTAKRRRPGTLTRCTCSPS